MEATLEEAASTQLIVDTGSQELSGRERERARKVVFARGFQDEKTFSGRHRSWVLFSQFVL